MERAGVGRPDRRWWIGVVLVLALAVAGCGGGSGSDGGSTETSAAETSATETSAPEGTATSTSSTATTRGADGPSEAFCEAASPLFTNVPQVLIDVDAAQRASYAAQTIDILEALAAEADGAAADTIDEAITVLEGVVSGATNGDPFAPPVVQAVAAPCADVQLDIGVEDGGVTVDPAEVAAGTAAFAIDAEVSAPVNVIVRRNDTGLTGLDALNVQSSADDLVLLEYLPAGSRSTTGLGALEPGAYLIAAVPESGAAPTASQVADLTVTA